MKEKKGIMGKIDNYVLFEELHIDSIGTNYRAAEIGETDNKPVKHALITEVHPFLFATPEEWNRTDVMCSRILESGIPNLYTPAKITREENGTFFVYPFIEGKTLAQIVEDAGRKDKPVPFQLAFSIAIAIASLIEVASSTAVKGQNTFHGFLTPDHIIFDYEGNIYLKYFGLWPLFDENQKAVSEMIRMYGAWLTPEFIRRERIVQQSDFYHLGYIVYRMLTGNYFSYLPGEDFATTFTSISFVSELPSTDIGFLTNLIGFFKKTLNPDINKRIPNIKEFKNYILQYFPTGESYEFKTALSVYMRELYMDAIEEEKQDLNEELSRAVLGAEPEKDLERERLMEHIPIEPGKKRWSKPLVLFLTAAVILVLVVIGYFVADQLSRAKKEKEEASKLLENQNKKLQEFQQQLKTLEVGKKPEASTVNVPDSKTADVTKNAKIEKIDEKKEKKEIPVTANVKKQDTALDKKSTGPAITTPQTIQKPVTDTSKETPSLSSPPVIHTVKPAETQGKKEIPTPSPSPAPIVPLNETTMKPQQVSSKAPEFSEAMRKTYVGRRATIKANLLIDENGNVTQVELLKKNEVPTDVQGVVIDTFKQWKFKPAQKGDMKVKTWWPAELKINFKSDI
jgi:hypothetical protein